MEGLDLKNKNIKGGRISIWACDTEEIGKSYLLLTTFIFKIEKSSILAKFVRKYFYYKN